MKHYAIGLDYGTLSARAVLADTANGRILAQREYAYPHGVITQWQGETLKQGWALQHPADYLEALYQIVPGVMEEAGILPEEVVGIGLDFTASTTLPVDKGGMPLCFYKEYETNPHALVKLWKHHGAQKQADEMTRVARETNQPWLAAYGGKVSCEWAFPKLWELLEEAPDLYAAMDEWMEAGDWMVLQLTGKRTRSASCAGYKSLYQHGYPSEAYFGALDPRLRHVIQEKYKTPSSPIGTKAGELTAIMAERLSLRPGIPVAVANVDGPVCAPAAGLAGLGQMLAIIGTSTGLFVLGEQETPLTIPGMCGGVRDGVLPGYTAYESGQCCVGDMFAWFCRNALPRDYDEAAAREGIPVQSYLTRLAATLKSGQSGLLALDWWNGNRSILVDSELTGLILGLTLQTRPEEIYRALLESTAFGVRVIMENYRAFGLPVKELVATGGISRKNPLAMQIYADVLQIPVHVASAEQGAAFGAAIFGAAVGQGESIEKAAGRMRSPYAATYWPNPEHQAVYDQLYGVYCRLHDVMGREENSPMKELLKIRNA